MVNETIVKLIQRVQEDPNPPNGYIWYKDTLRYKGNIFLVNNSTLEKTILEELHSSPIMGHSRFHKTYERDNRSHSFRRHGNKHPGFCGNL